MSILLEWDKTNERLFETGVEKGVVYPWDETKNNNKGDYGDGAAWNGLTGVTESPSGAEASKLYADNINYLTMYSVEEFGATIEAYTYPDEFAECDGSATAYVMNDSAKVPVPGVSIGQQARKAFGFTYVSKVGNDVKDTEYGYKLHLLYGCKASPSERAYSTINDSPEAMNFSWEITTTPEKVTGFKPTSIITIDSTKLDVTGKAHLAALENILYGTAAVESPETPAVPARLPHPDEVISIMANGVTAG